MFKLEYYDDEVGDYTHHAYISADEAMRIATTYGYEGVRITAPNWPGAIRVEHDPYHGDGIAVDLPVRDTWIDNGCHLYWWQSLRHLGVPLKEIVQRLNAAGEDDQWHGARFEHLHV